MEHIVDIPATTLDYDQILAESDPLKRDALLDEADWQKEMQRSAWEWIVTAPRFTALMFEQRSDWPLTLILHPSTRPGVDLQLSRFDWSGCPEGHGDFFRADLEMLYEELIWYARGGVRVRVLYTD